MTLLRAGWGGCVEFLGKTLLCPQCVSLHTSVSIGSGKPDKMLGEGGFTVYLQWTSLIQGENHTLSCATKTRRVMCNIKNKI